jgi:hypothetical protein
MTNLRHWIALNWGPLSIVACLTAGAGGVYKLFLWFFPNRKEWKEQHRMKIETEIDAAIIEAMRNKATWEKLGKAHILGHDWLAASEIAAVTEMKVEDVEAGLERLAFKGLGFFLTFDEEWAELRHLCVDLGFRRH